MFHFFLLQFVSVCLFYRLRLLEAFNKGLCSLWNLFLGALQFGGHGNSILPPGSRDMDFKHPAATEVWEKNKYG